ncbi:hypothetical protein FRC08_011848, partial [Ceratobasidium sp. 394]
AWCWIGPGYQLEWFLYLYAWVFLSLVNSIVMYGLVSLRLSGRLSFESGKLAWRVSRQNRGLNCFTSSWAAHDNSLSFPSEPDSSGGHTDPINGVSKHLKGIAMRLMLYPLAYSIVTIPIVILRIGTTAGWDPPRAYPLFAGVTFSCSGLANVVLFITTRRSFIQQAAAIQPRVHVSTQQLTVLEDSQGVQTVHLHELAGTSTRPEDQDCISETADLERDGSFKTKQRMSDLEESQLYPP